MQVHSEGFWALDVVITLVDAVELVSLKVGSGGL